MYERFKDKVRAANLAEMGSLSSRNPGVKYLLCAIDNLKYRCYRCLGLNL